MYGGTARVQAITAELDRAADDYDIAKREFDRARVEFEAARERLTSVKVMAEQMLTTADWWGWQNSHPEVRYAAMSAGDAIITLLRMYAYQVATAHLMQPDTRSYDPYLALDQIAGALESGGFEFRSTATGREINAALINLTGVKKSGDGKYAIAESDQILEWSKTIQEMEQRQQ